jgi:prepilin-type N-terminal cleavage/methylation domain-containing protein
MMRIMAWRPTRNSAFTIVELLVVMAIIGTLILSLHIRRVRSRVLNENCRNPKLGAMPRSEPNGSKLSLP